MNDKKIAFIICTNNEIYLSECLHYLNNLYIPEGYETAVLTISEAVSMTAGYNEGMRATDAKYKVYMHQDVFIVNRYFISDMLSIFESDHSIGLLGMVGYPVVPASGMMWTVPREGVCFLYGQNHFYPDADYNTYRYSPAQDGITEVALIDGLLMATAYDVEWNEAELDGWHLYDAFQSMDFLLHGYKVVVPNQSLPWFIHDDGKYLKMWGYDKYRKKFLDKYSKNLGMTCREIRQKYSYKK